GTIIHTVNGGENWNLQTSGTTQDLQDVAFVDANTGWAVGSKGTILHTADGGDHWIVQESATEKDLLGVSFIDASTGWIVGEKGIVLKYSTLNAVENHNSSLLPGNCLLYSSYPNPFPGRRIGYTKTTILYYLPAPSRVLLRVYDTLGRAVRTLADEQQPAGLHSIQWDGKDKNGVSVPSGIYFLRMDARNNAKSIKIVVL
ncbi:MAG: hypothetical protein DRI01_07010, partial [Chloroflexi bacterium]